LFTPPLPLGLPLTSQAATGYYFVPCFSGLDQNQPNDLPVLLLIRLMPPALLASHRPWWLAGGQWGTGRGKLARFQVTTAARLCCSVPPNVVEPPFTRGKGNRPGLTPVMANRTPTRLPQFLHTLVKGLTQKEQQGEENMFLFFPSLGCPKGNWPVCIVLPV